MSSTSNQLYQQAQRSLVASLVYDGVSANSVFELIKPKDIEDAQLELIITSMMQLARKNEPISIVTIAKELNEIGALTQVGGISELYTLRNEGEKRLLEAPVQIYARIVRESSAKSKIGALIQESKNDFNDDSGLTAFDAVGDFQSKLSETMLDFSDNTTITEISTYMKSYFDVLDRRLEISKENEEKADGLQGIPSLLPTLNKYTHGWQPQQLITIGARTGVGKSVFAVMSAVAAAQAGKSVLIFSLEMSHADVIDRIVACISGVSMTKLKNGRLTPDEVQLVRKASEELDKMKIQIDADPKATVDTIRSKALKAAQSADGLDLIVLDYLQLITPVGRHSSRQEAVSEISRSMKLLAKALDLPIMVLVQLNRAKNDDDDEKMPTLDNIRESGAIAMDSDIVILLHREQAHDDTTPQTIVILEKNRNGESKKSIRCHSNLACSLLREITREKEASERLTDDDMEKLEEDLDLSEFDDLDDDIDIEDL